MLKGATGALAVSEVTDVEVVPVWLLSAGAEFWHPVNNKRLAVKMMLAICFITIKLMMF